MPSDFGQIRPEVGCIIGQSSRWLEESCVGAAVRPVWNCPRFIITIRINKVGSSSRPRTSDLIILDNYPPCHTAQAGLQAASTESCVPPLTKRCNSCRRLSPRLPRARAKLYWFSALTAIFPRQQQVKHGMRAPHYLIDNFIPANFGSSWTVRRFFCA